ncbi:MAG TPA: chromophore lyase CpcT/CpeT [Ignavibacteria bacterium]|nr:chromophore lyase CpcT/CpeT [Ignavibacteria bacterium]HMR41197.1 chromophore lyase CpcT/CpeT [Ignavibacteria bacterium]
MPIKNFILTALLIFSTAGTSFSQIKSIDIDALVSMMEGSFSSGEQSKNDSDYFDIRLEMKRIWPERTDGKWLYVEQAVASSLDKPYRQRVYQVKSTYEGRFESIVYTINDPLRFAGVWKEEDPLSELTPDSLTLRNGCTVTLTLMEKGVYEGGTEGDYCESDLRGARYATSEVKITGDGIISWDRGFDAEGNQVWGAEKGGYVFLRVKN